MTEDFKDPAFLAGDAVYRLRQALQEVLTIASTSEGTALLADDWVLLNKANLELREVARKVTMKAIGWRAA